jgi:ribosomal protein S18 acetylase RimI-like enzyme
MDSNSMNTTSIYSIQTSNWRDLFALSALEKECFDQDAWPLLELMGVLTFPGVVRLRAVIAGEMVGFIAGDPRRSEKTGWILTLGVLPNWRRQGIAFDLLSTCEKQMGMPLVKLTVRRNNLAAICLYEKMGYQQMDIWSRYYRNGEDGLVLEKRIL